ncbi:MAG: protease modulator HflC [Verrucomicrobiae bacterium]|nr:protease modulator HflC [Verrucomicrobiae bacterium]MDW8344720.1 protease modulator HflC [Verrucomicrobiae bacterium]
MKRNALLLTVGLVVAALFLLLQVMFVVREGEVAVVTTFGKPHRELNEAGLYFRWPWPVQRVHRFDSRLQMYEGPFEELLTRDGKNVLVSVYAAWRIERPVLFLERVGDMQKAERNLDGLLRHYKSAVIGQVPFSALVNTRADEIRHEQIEQQMLTAMRAEAAARYGVTVEFLGIRRLGLPEAITQKVFQRMRAERNEIAERYRSEGEAEAIKIRAQAQSERDQLLARAEAEAIRLRAQADAEAAAYFDTFKKDEAFANFLKKLEALEAALQSNATLVISADYVPFDLLRGERALPTQP